jgi:hypothetical protein
MLDEGGVPMPHSCKLMTGANITYDLPEPLQSVKLKDDGSFFLSMDNPGTPSIMLTGSGNDVPGKMGCTIARSGVAQKPGIECTIASKLATPSKKYTLAQPVGNCSNECSFSLTPKQRVECTQEKNCEILGGKEPVPLGGKNKVFSLDFLNPGTGVKEAIILVDGQQYPNTVNLSGSSSCTYHGDAEVMACTIMPACPRSAILKSPNQRRYT